MDLTSEATETSVGVTMTAKSEEDRLIEAARSGDSAAFETLVMRYRRLLLAMIRRMIASPEETEDLAQQALLKAYVNLHTFGGRCSFSTWLVSIARNEARMWNRKRRRSPEVAMADFSIGKPEDAPPDFMDTRPGPEAVCSQKESSEILYSAMKRLSPVTRQALRLCDLEEESTVTAALVVGATVSALKTRRFRGRLALRRALESSLRRRSAALANNH
jgi:RNA polymerase sigma-70 factor (ECF subfamily)